MRSLALPELHAERARNAFPVAYCMSVGRPTKQKGFVIQPIEFEIADNPGGPAYEEFDIS